MYIYSTGEVSYNTDVLEDMKFLEELEKFFLEGCEVVQYYPYRAGILNWQIFDFHPGKYNAGILGALRYRLHNQWKAKVDSKTHRHGGIDNHECFTFKDKYGNIWGIKWSDHAVYVGEIMTNNQERNIYFGSIYQSLFRLFRT